MKDEEVKLLAGIQKAEKFTYGLLYPAFFGNMIYDLIQSYTERKTLPGIELGIGILIVLFYAIDFTHLYGDVETYVKKAIKVKNLRYILCDLITSILFFLSLVSLKYCHLKLSIIEIGIVPAIIAIYKWEYNIDHKDKYLSLGFGIITVLLFLAIAFFVENKGVKEISFFVALLFSLLFYGWYIFIFYRKRWKERWPVG